MNEQIRGGIIANAIVLASSALLMFFLSWTGVNKNLSATISGVLLIIGTLVVWRIQLSIGERKKRISLQFMEEKMGLVEVYKNLHQAGKDMQKDFKQARTTKLLLQLGRYEYTGRLSFLYEATKNKIGNDISIKVLYASSKSPHLSQGRAKLLGKKHLEWQKNIQHLGDSLTVLRDNYSINIDVRQHCEPFFWKIYVFDDVAYFSPYFFSTKNNDVAPVYKYKFGECSLYKVLNEYFDNLWDFHAPQEDK